MNPGISVAHVETTLRSYFSGSPLPEYCRNEMLKHLSDLKAFLEEANEFLQDSSHFRRHEARLNKEANSLRGWLNNIITQWTAYSDVRKYSNIKNWLDAFHYFRQSQMDCLFESYIYDVGGES